MGGQEERQRGFSIVEAVLIVVALAIIGTVGWFVYQHDRTKVTNVAANTNQSINQQKSATTTQPPSDPYAGWKTFTDNASAGTSGISIKYPSDWQVHVGGSKIYAWSISGADSGIAARYVFLDNSWTAQQEWEDCAVQISADACGAAPGDKTVSGSTSTINGLNAYTATMQNTTNGTYHVTVIRGGKSVPPAGTPYVEFTTYSTDQAALSTFDKIVASATFPN